MATDLLAFGPHACLVLEKRYLARNREGRVLETPEEMLARVASAVAGGEQRWGGGASVLEYQEKFFALMAGGLFLPNSPCLMNAGRPLGQLSACFVLPVGDSLEEIFEAVKQTAIIHKSGGGTGFSFSGLRPAGDQVATTGGVSSGPVSFMTVFDVATEAIKQGGTRRGANMGILKVSHPDIETFIRAKETLGRLKNFNLSVMVPDDFMGAVRRGGEWPLVNPHTQKTVKRMDAAKLFEQIVRSAHASGEPGLAYYGAINRGNPTPALGVIEATNPCGEQPLLPYESCNLGSVVLSAFVKNRGVDYAALEETAGLAVRFLDNAVEVNRPPLPRIAQSTGLTRKIGLGVMGFADLLLDLGIPYGSPEAATLGKEIMARIAAAGRAMSQHLAKTRGSFPAFPQSRWRKEGLVRLRNATITTVAPTGTLSLIMGCSSGIEPHFSLAYTRRALEGVELVEFNPRFLARLGELGLDNEDNRQRLARSGLASSVPGLSAEDAELFATAHEVDPEGHLAVQAAFQASTDNAVSKTVNLPAGAPVEAVRSVFTRAFELGLKGVTVFRSGSRGRQVLELAPLPGEESRPMANGVSACPRCGGTLLTEGGCRTCSACGASGCE